MRQSDLEQRPAWHLKELPGFPAPPTLLPRVMAAVQAWTLRPWYARAWLTWPLRWRLASGVALVASAAALAMGFPGVEADAQLWMKAMVVRSVPSWSDLGGDPEGMLRAARTVWRALVHPVLIYACALIAVMTATTATLTVALTRAMFGRASHS